MPFTTDACTPLLRHCVLVMFRAAACTTEAGEPLPAPTLGGKLTLSNPARVQVPDGNGGYYLTGQAVQLFSGAAPGAWVGSSWQVGWEQVTHDGCDYWAVRLCALPANVDTAYDPTDPASINRGLEVGGTSWLLELNVGGIGQMRVPFVLDAAQDYSTVEIDGCVPLTALSNNPGPPMGSGEFADAVCTAMQSFPAAAGDLPGSVRLIGDDCRRYLISASGLQDTFVTWVDNLDGSTTFTSADGTDTVTLGAGGNTDSWCDQATALPEIADPVTVSHALVTGDDGACYRIPANDVCQVALQNGLTGKQSGAFTDGCTIEAMPAGGNPETGFPAAGFPEGWRQLFSGGVTGTETWIVLADTTGTNQWHQTA